MNERAVERGADDVGALAAGAAALDHRLEDGGEVGQRQVLEAEALDRRRRAGAGLAARRSDRLPFVILEE